MKESWEMVITHNDEGDYGHFQHRQVYELVRDNYNKNNLYYPVKNKELFCDEYRLSTIDSDEKINFFKENYKSQLHILELYQEYFKYEKIVKES